MSQFILHKQLKHHSYTDADINEDHDHVFFCDQKIFSVRQDKNMTEFNSPSISNFKAHRQRCSYIATAKSNQFKMYPHMVQ